MHEANQPISLGEMQIEFAIDGRLVRTPARVVEKLFPKPRVVLEVSNVPREPQGTINTVPGRPSTMIRTSPLMSEGPSTIRLENGTEVEVVPGSWVADQRDAILSLARLPCVVLRSNNPITRMQLSILNFSSSVRGYSFVLQAPPWAVRIEPVPNLWELEKMLRSDGGYAITNQGTIERSDGEAYSVDDVADLLDGLEHFLSFVCGCHCSLTNVIGIDSKGNEAWKRWGARRVSRWRTHRSWFDIAASDALFDIFPVLLQEYKDNKDVLGRILQLYAYSNDTGVFDVSIILTQVALESLSYMTVGGESGGKPGKRIATALQKAGIETQIPSEFKNLEDLRKREGWEHGPHTIVGMRNSMIHAESLSGDIPTDAYYEAMNLGLWYLELLLLKKFHYTGEYASRLIPVQRAGDTKLVPWAQGDGEQLEEGD